LVASRVHWLHPYGVKAVVLVVALVGVAGAQPTKPGGKPGTGKPAGKPAWVGVFRPRPDDVTPADDRTVIAHAGEVVVLTPSDGPAPTGAVTIVQPLVGMNLAGTIDARGRIALPLFAFDRRPGADAVLLLPPDARVVFVEPSKGDVAMIRAALMRNEVLSGVPRALKDIEVGAIDVDGDHRPDFAITYGCNAWADGQCQSRGEFLLASRGTTWVELE
jgi:hypothetical protein